MKTLTSNFRTTEELSSLSPVDPDAAIGRETGVALRCRHDAADACVFDDVAAASFAVFASAG